MYEIVVPSTTPFRPKLGVNASERRRFGAATPRRIAGEPAGAAGGDQHVAGHARVRIDQPIRDEEGHRGRASCEFRAEPDAQDRLGKNHEDERQRNDGGEDVARAS